MSLWNDFWDFVDDTVHDVGDTIHDAWVAIKNNPIGAITSAVAMAYGIPPMWAGALGGAAGAAATGGDVVKAAVTGGAMGYFGAAAGAAAGEAGALAQAAASGAGAAVTGAVLTGQDVATAAKQGLILGTVMYGGQKTFQLMTQQEAIASVPKETLANLQATSADPLGDLIDKMGWTSSDSAVASASKAFSQNINTTQTMLQDSIPSYVLEAARDSVNPGQYIIDELGWKPNSLTVAAAERTFAKFDNAATQAEQAVKAEAAKPANQIKNTGLVGETDANILAANGYSADQVKTLINKGYTPTELVNMAATGVDGSELLSINNSPFKPDQINSMISHGSDVTQINSVGRIASTYGIDLNSAQQLVESGLTANSISRLAYNGDIDVASKLVNQGVTGKTIADMYSYGRNLDAASAQLEKGFVTPEQVNDAFTSGNYTKSVNEFDNLMKSTTNQYDLQKTQLAKEQALVDQQQLEAQANLQHIKDVQAAQSLADMSGGYLTAADIVNQNLSQADVEWYKNYMDQRLGKVEPQPQPEPVQPEVTQPTQVAQPQQPVQPEVVEPLPVQPQQPQYSSITGNGLLDMGNGLAVDTNGNLIDPNTGFIERAGFVDPNGTMNLDSGSYHVENGKWVQNSVDVSNITQEQLNQITQQNNPYMNTNEGSTTASGYTPEQEQMYNQLRGQGYSAQQATDMITNGTVSDVPQARVDVTGTPAFAENPGSAVPQYRTPNTDLATQAQIDSGQASFNQAANSWEIPTTPEVVVTAPKIETPIVPIVVPPTTPPVTTPVVQQPAQPPAVTQPVTPPTVAQPTVVSSSTRTTMDGSVYKDDQMSDGTVSTVLVSGPTGTGTGTGTGGTTTTPQQPLTPPKQEVIPPGSSYVAPVEVTPPPVTEPPVTQPPVDTTTPFVPFVPPTGTPPETGDGTHYGTFKIGQIPTINVPQGLNPGWITNVPQHYQTTNPAESKYYWGAHPFQAGTTFNRELYNQIPNAPQTPFGLGYAQTAATPQQIMQAMQGVYPLLNSVSGPVAPAI